MSQTIIRAPPQGNKRKRLTGDLRASQGRFGDRAGPGRYLTALYNKLPK